MFRDFCIKQQKRKRRKRGEGNGLCLFFKEISSGICRPFKTWSWASHEPHTIVSQIPACASRPRSSSSRDLSCSRVDPVPVFSAGLCMQSLPEQMSFVFIAVYGLWLLWEPCAESVPALLMLQVTGKQCFSFSLPVIDLFTSKAEGKNLKSCCPLLRIKSAAPPSLPLVSSRAVSACKPRCLVPGSTFPSTPPLVSIHDRRGERRREKRYCPYLSSRSSAVLSWEPSSF